MFLANYVAAGLMLWIGGADALPYGLAILIVTIVVTITVLGYASRRRADYAPELFDVLRTRGVLVVVINLFAVSGLIRAFRDLDSSGEGFTGNLADGAIAGMVIGAAAGGYSLWRKSKDASESEGQ